MENSFSPEPSHSGRHDTPSLRQYTADIGSQDDIQNVGGLPPVEQTRNQEDKQANYNSDWDEVESDQQYSQVDHFGYESPEMELPDSKDDDNESAVADDEDPYKRVYTPALPRTEETLDQVQYDPPEAEQIERGDVKGELMDELVDTVEESDAANSPRKKRKKKKKKQVKNGVKDGETDGNEEKVMLQRRGESSGSLNVRLTPIGQNTETLQEEDTPSVLPPDSWKKAYDLPVQSDITYGEENKDNGAQSSWYPSVQHITQHYENGRDMSQDQGYSSEVRQRAAEGQRDHHETWGKPDDERQKSLVIGVDRESTDWWGSVSDLQKHLHDPNSSNNPDRSNVYTSPTYTPKFPTSEVNTVPDGPAFYMYQGTSDLDKPDDLGHQGNKGYTPDLDEGHHQEQIPLAVYELPSENQAGEVSNGKENRGFIAQSDVETGQEEHIAMALYEVPTETEIGHVHTVKEEAKVNQTYVQPSLKQTDCPSEANLLVNKDLKKHHIENSTYQSMSAENTIHGFKNEALEQSDVPLFGQRLPPEGADASPSSTEVRQRPSKGQRSCMEEEKQRLIHQRKRSFVIGSEDSEDGIGCCGWILYIFSILLIILTLPFSLMFTIKVVQEYERAVIFRLGRLPQGGAKGPGIFFIMPCIENYTKIDLRTVTFDVPPQEVLTKDSVTVSVDAVVYYQVSNPTVSVANVENAHHSTRLLAQTTLRNILGTKDMSEILSDREGISQGMQSTLDNATDRWGIQVERVEIKDVRLPVQLQRAMAAEAEASREARAKVIAAEGEFNASRALRDAAVIMDTSPAALQLRYLQTLNSISAEKNSTIIFPVPINLLAKKQS